MIKYPNYNNTNVIQYKSYINIFDAQSNNINILTPNSLVVDSHSITAFAYLSPYIEFIDYVFINYCVLNPYVNTGISCFIYGFLITPILLTLYILEFIIISSIFIITLTYINNRFNLLLKTILHEDSYAIINKILKQSFDILLNSFLIYISFIFLLQGNIFNIAKIIKSTALGISKKLPLLNVYIYKSNRNISYLDVNSF